MAIGKNKTFQKNDHREINKKLKFFHFSENVGSSLPIWLPNGELVKHLIKQYLKKLETEYNFNFVTTPVLGKIEMYKTSGHLEHYQEYMFPAIKVNEQKLMLRPMACPHHCKVFCHQNYSYQDLPVRMSENVLLFRYEKSGAIHGLERVRQMELKDAHIFLPKNKSIIKKEITNCFFMIKTALRKLGLKIDKIYLSLHDSENMKKYYHDINLWKKTENILEEVLTELKVTFEKVKGEAAFYGPKIDFQVNTVLQHDVTISTIQLDFLLGEKFKLKYRTKKQNKGEIFATPIVVHLGTIGTYERLLSLLLEQKNGWLPFWLSPAQIMIFSMNNDETAKKYAQKVFEFLKSHDLRVEMMDVNKKISENIKLAWERKVPVHIFLGKQETESKTITYIHHNHPQTKHNKDIFQLIDQCQKWMNNIESEKNKKQK